MQFEASLALHLYIARYTVNRKSGCCRAVQIDKNSKNWYVLCCFGSLPTPSFLCPLPFSPDWDGISEQSIRSGKSQNESFPNFSNFRPEFCPEFCSEFSPNFSRTFRASFRGRRRPEKIQQKSPPFFIAKFPGKHEKIIHKLILGNRQSNRAKIGSGPERYAVQAGETG